MPCSGGVTEALTGISGMGNAHQPKICYRAMDPAHKPDN